MTALTRWIMVGLALAVLACSDIAAPLRNDFYEWRLFRPSASGSGTDTIGFHWPQSRLPVRVWVEQSGALPGDIALAIATWRSAFLYGEYDATVVSDSSRADVIVRSGPAPGPKLSMTRLHSALAPQCEGATDLDVSDDHRTLRLPIRISIDPLSDPTAAGLGGCLTLTTLHEVGHSLGIFEHSTDPGDLMYVNPSVARPSARDFGTAELLYHVPATLEAVGP